jgi:hypothetical protein
LSVSRRRRNSFRHAVSVIVTQHNPGEKSGLDLPSIRDPAASQLSCCDHFPEYLLYALLALPVVNERKSPVFRQLRRWLLSALAILSFGDYVYKQSFRTQSTCAYTLQHNIL